ncbi:gag/pol protein [Gossypium australe]|uniref:Gag/pol protein n=1 Tax=Gossypium australe TaxID=47621 RepID=A0A5B6W9N7_9ROSI|nr:gag/pol protein [Gossypium australe]
MKKKILKSIRILLSIAVALNYEKWKMDVKTVFLNDYIEESIYMMQPTGYLAKGNEHKVWKLLSSIYGLKQSSLLWNQRFDQVIKTLKFEKNVDEPCIYKLLRDGNVVFIILYVNDILLTGYDVQKLSSIKLTWEKLISFLVIRILRDRKNKVIALFQASYIDKLLECYAMTNSNKGNQLFVSGFNFSLEDYPKTMEEREEMRKVPYASSLRSPMHATLCTRPDICFVVGLANPGPRHWQRMRDYMLVYFGGDLTPIGYTDSDFLMCWDSRKPTLGCVLS